MIHLLVADALAVSIPFWIFVCRVRPTVKAAHRLSFVIDVSWDTLSLISAVNLII